MTAAPTPGPPRRPWLFWPAVLVSLAAFAAGIVVAVTSYERTSGPAGVVHAYFTALQRSDAASALGFGDVPRGPHTLLTDAALREQQRIAPIRDVHTGPARRTGSRAVVGVGYRLAFPTAEPEIHADVRLHESGGTWRLDASAVRTALALSAADQRATVMGGSVPTGDVLIFPGAAPVRFDTPYITLVPADADVTFGADPTSRIGVEVSRAGRTALEAATVAAVRRCVSSEHPNVTCPLPTERYIPGSLRGRVTGGLTNPSVMLTDTGVGALQIDADVPVRATTYRRLDFREHVITGTGPVTVRLHALATAVPPLTVIWVAA